MLRHDGEGVCGAVRLAFGDPDNAARRLIQATECAVAVVLFQIKMFEQTPCFDLLLTPVHYLAEPPSKPGRFNPIHDGLGASTKSG